MLYPCCSVPQAPFRTLRCRSPRFQPLGYAGLLAGPPLLGFVAHASSLAGIFYVAARSTVLIAALSISLRASKDSEGCAQA